MRALLVILACVGAAAPPELRAEEPPRQRQGPYEATLMLPPAGLYAGEEMEIEFRVVDLERPDAGGAPAPLPWGELLAEVSMPSMPSMPGFSEVAHREGIPGVFGVHPTFPHGGEYRFCLTLVPPSGAALPGVGRPSVPLTFEFPLTVWDASSSPTPVPARIRPFSLDVTTTPRIVVSGDDTTLDLSVRMTGSRELREVTEFDVEHERLMHLFLVRDDLRYFAHEHPDRVGPGAFRLRHRFPAPGRYRVYADVAPKDAGAQVLTGEVLVSGLVRPDPPTPPSRSAAALALPEGGVPAGRTVTVTASVTDPGGGAARDLEPWLGAMGHLLLVSRDGSTFAHAHPDDRVRGVGEDGVIPFLVRLPTPGAYKGWLQVQRSGRVDTVEVEIEAKKPY